MKTIWIVDGAYLFNYGKYQFQIDYLKLKNALEKIGGSPISEGYYHNSIRNPNDDSQNGFHTFLKSAPPRGPKMRVKLYKLKSLGSRCPSCDCEFSRDVQKGVDVGIATLIIRLATQNLYDRLILTAGDGDFEDAIEYVKSALGKEIWLNGGRDSLSTDLQSYSNEILWFEDLRTEIEKEFG